MSPLYPTFRFKSEDRCDRSDGNVLCARRPVWSPPLPSASGFDWWGETGSLFWKRACLKIGCSKIHQNPMVDFHVPHENIGNLCYLDVYLSSRHTRWCTPKYWKRSSGLYKHPGMSFTCAAPEQQPLDQSYPRRSSTVRSVSARSQWSLPDPNSNLWIKVIPAGLRPDVFTWFGLTDQIWANNRHQVEWNELVS